MSDISYSYSSALNVSQHFS